jgi:hypothetical protein
MKKLLILFILLVAYKITYSQQNYYDVTAGDGYGLRFWNSGDLYKIHMGNSAEYHFGPVTDYSIKVNMNETTGRGWTWGISGQTPVVGISNVGHMKIAGTFSTDGYLDIAPSFYTTQGTIIVRPGDSGYEGGEIVLAGSQSYNSWSIDNNGGHLRLHHSGNEYFRMQSNGYLGLGTLGPSAKLHIVNQNTDSGGNTLILGPTNQSNLRLGYHQNYSWIQSHGGKPLVINAFGNNVAIGTSTPDPNAKLTVKGTIHVEEVKVDLNVEGPDYVFEPNYPLTSLEDTKAYIEQNKHLPGIPSSDEMQENGVNILEMNMKLLEKVEELTLHLISINAENTKLKERVLKLENNQPAQSTTRK